MDTHKTPWGRLLGKNRDLGNTALKFRRGRYCKTVFGKMVFVQKRYQRRESAQEIASKDFKLDPEFV